MDYNSRIAKKIVENLYNEYLDNYDYSIRDTDKKDKYKVLLTKSFNYFIKKISNNLHFNLLHKNYYWQNIEKFEYLYDKLSDERSKKILIELLTYKILGYDKVKLSLNNMHYWRIREISDGMKLPKKIKANYGAGFLYLYDLNKLNIDVKLFYLPIGIVSDFILEQYNYQSIVCVRDGDIVIDAGGCWGDTALYFSTLGAKDIYSFEFIPSNIRIMQKNIQLNPQYKDKIHIIEKAIWDDSEVKMSYIDKGPSSKIDIKNKYKCILKTLSIDDLVQREKIEKVDFIKMDIEGAELKALKGSTKTIRRYRPKLAISVYHKPDDLYRLPKFIHSIREDYKFYLDYYTIIADEIILYAI